MQWVHIQSCLFTTPWTVAHLLQCLLPNALVQARNDFQTCQDSNRSHSKKGPDSRDMLKCTEEDSLMTGSRWEGKRW